MSGPRRFRAPGRVNLIGEHTDYNLGFVLPIALDLATEVDTLPGSDNLLVIRSEDRDDPRSVSVDDLSSAKPAKHWSDYVIGVARELIVRGFRIEPLQMTIRSTVPVGSGLSSSAALEVSSALALLQGRELDRLEIARLCQHAEIDFVGVPCGIMDQFVSVFGVQDAALCLDCRSLEAKAVPLPKGVTVVAVNSMVKHQLGDSAYRTRVAECAEACRALGVESLRDATLETLGRTKMADKPFHRAWHVLTENDRVLRFVTAAEAGDLNEMGQLFIESHASMKSDYEISAAEIDYLVAEAVRLPGCYGARMTGGGFGGSTVNLVADEAVPAFETAIAASYQKAWGINPAIYRCRPGVGAGEIH
ncbi:MAG: galactokinase [Bryobacterales bacterium]|nr:galactokinase [Bryobacterales bacterium]